MSRAQVAQETVRSMGRPGLAVLQNDPGPGTHHRSSGEHFQDPRAQLRIIGWIDESHIERPLPCQPEEAGGKPAGERLSPALQSAGQKVFSDGPDIRAARLDEGRLDCTTTECLDSHGSGAGKEVQKTMPPNSLPQDVEQ